MDDAHLSGNDNYTFSRASSHESSSDMGMLNGQQERIYNNQKYNVINNDVSSSSKVKIKRTLTASNNNRTVTTTTTSHEKESSHRNITESSVSHSNDAVNGNDQSHEMEMKPIKEDKKSGLIVQQQDREQPKNTNQCLRCVIL